MYVLGPSGERFFFSYIAEETTRAGLHDVCHRPPIDPKGGGALANVTQIVGREG